MKTPNILSLVAMLVVILPGVSLALTQQFPAEQYWWAALITGLIGAAVKALQVWLGAQPQPLPPNVESLSAPEPEPKSAVSRWLAD